MLVTCRMQQMLKKKCEDTKFSTHILVNKNSLHLVSRGDAHRLTENQRFGPNNSSLFLGLTNDNLEIRITWIRSRLPGRLSSRRTSVSQINHYQNINLVSTNPGRSLVSLDKRIMNKTTRFCILLAKMRDLSNKEQDFDGQKCNLNVI